MTDFRRVDVGRDAKRVFCPIAAEDRTVLQVLSGEQTVEEPSAATHFGEHDAVPQTTVASPGGGWQEEGEPESRLPLVGELTGSRRWKGPKRAFVHDLALTMGAEAGTVLSSLLLTSIVGRWMGSRSLSEYLLLRRVLSWMLAATMVGLITGLPRYVAQAAGRREEDEQGYFLAALTCLIVTAALAGGTLILARREFARWLFGNPQEAGLVMALALLLFGYAIHRSVSGYYRGLLEMIQANLMEVLNLALLPLVVVLALFHSRSIAAMMAITGGLMTLIGALFAVPLLCRLRWRAVIHTLWARSRELLHYGLPRIPGEFGVATGMALGPMLAVHYMSIDQVAPLLLGMSMLLVIGYAAGPLGSLLVSKVSMMLGRNQQEQVRAHMRLLIVAVMEIAAFACFQLMVFAGVVVRAWVGPGFENQMGVIRLVLVAIPAYLFFAALRTTIDAASVKPFNTGNVLISLTVYVVLMAGWIALFPGRTLLLGIAGSLMATQILLAVLTARTFRKLYGVGIPWRRLAPSFAAAAALGAVALAFRMAAGVQAPLPAAILAEAVLASLYLAFLAKRRSGWVVYTWNVGVRRRMNWSANELQP